MRKILEGPCYRENCIGPMKFVDGIYVCQSCWLASTAENYILWLETGDGTNDSDDDDYYGVPGYDELYDQHGDYVYCPNCYISYTPLKMHNDTIVCPRCGFTMTEEEFNNYIGLA